MKTRCIPASSGPGRSKAFDATRSSNRSHFMLRSVSVPRADSNWKTPAVLALPEHFVHRGIVERERSHVGRGAGLRADHLDGRHG